MRHPKWQFAILKGLMVSLVFLSISWAVNGQAKTATVNYAFTQFNEYSVIVWVSETAGIDTATQMFGQTDVDEDGIVDIGNIQPGKTYYFRARAYNKLTGVPTGWSNEMSQDVPMDVLPSPLGLPVVPEINIPGFSISEIVLKAN